MRFLPLPDGYHVCLGTFPQFPVVPVEDIGIPVRMANAVVANTERRIDYVHLPVVPDVEVRSAGEPRHRHSEVFLGVECKDGEENYFVVLALPQSTCPASSSPISAATGEIPKTCCRT